MGERAHYLFVGFQPEDLESQFKQLNVQTLKITLIPFPLDTESLKDVPRWTQLRETEEGLKGHDSAFRALDDFAQAKDREDCSLDIKAYSVPEYTTLIQTLQHRGGLDALIIDARHCTSFDKTRHLARLLLPCLELKERAGIWPITYINPPLWFLKQGFETALAVSKRRRRAAWSTMINRSKSEDSDSSPSSSEGASSSSASCESEGDAPMRRRSTVFSSLSRVLSRSTSTRTSSFSEEFKPTVERARTIQRQAHLLVLIDEEKTKPAEKELLDRDLSQFEEPDDPWARLELIYRDYHFSHNLATLQSWQWDDFYKGKHERSAPLFRPAFSKRQMRGKAEEKVTKAKISRFEVSELRCVETHVVYKDQVEKRVKLLLEPTTGWEF